MTKIHFIVEDVPACSLVARAMGAEIFTAADDMQALHAQVREGVLSA